MGHDTIDGGADNDVLSWQDRVGGFQTSPRSYTVTSDRMFDGAGLVDTSFTNIEQIRLGPNAFGTYN